MIQGRGTRQAAGSHLSFFFFLFFSSASASTSAGAGCCMPSSASVRFSSSSSFAFFSCAAAGTALHYTLYCPQLFGDALQLRKPACLRYFSHHLLHMQLMTQTRPTQATSRTWPLPCQSSGPANASLKKETSMARHAQLPCAAHTAARRCSSTRAQVELTALLCCHPLKCFVYALTRNAHSLTEHCRRTFFDSVFSTALAFSSFSAAAAGAVSGSSAHPAHAV